MTSDDNGAKTAAEMVSGLQRLFESREKSLQEREESLAKRQKLFDERHPQAGNDSDVIHLNVGGSTNIAVLRRTLTHFENSMLASRFSGRWDDSLEKDKDGNFFIDQDPQVFGLLLKFLRQCDQRKGDDAKIKPPSPTFDFCFMLEYYDLMSSVYPQKWHQILGTEDSVVMTRERKTTGDFLTISGGIGMKAFMVDFENCPYATKLKTKSFTAVLEQGSTGQVGWGTGLSTDTKLGNDDDNVSFAFDLESSAFMSKRTKRGNGHEWCRRLPVTIRCSCNVTTNTYSIQVIGEESDATVMATLTIFRQSLYPLVNFSGKVTISDVSYHY